MAGKKSGLGRGLDALFPEKVSQEKPKTVRSSKPKTKYSKYEINNRTVRCKGRNDCKNFKSRAES